MGDIGKVMEDMFLALLSYVAEQEIQKRYQRQMEGQAVVVNMTYILVHVELAELK